MTDEERFQDLGEAFAQMARDFAASLAAFLHAMSAYWDGVSGPQLRTIVQYYAEHPEELEALVAAREKGYQESACHCFCQWRHRGACAGTADTTRPFNGVSVPMCTGCAAEADHRRALILNDAITDPTPRDSLGPRPVEP